MPLQLSMVSNHGCDWSLISKIANNNQNYHRNQKLQQQKSENTETQKSETRIYKTREYKNQKIQQYKPENTKTQKCETKRNTEIEIWQQYRNVKMQKQKYGDNT